MHVRTENASDDFAMLANGVSQHWEISVDESLDRDNEWSLEIEGPAIYLVIQLHDLKLISKTVAFFESRLDGHQPPRQAGEPMTDDCLVIGKFGNSAVELVWDNEDVVRCFLVIGSRARSTMRLTLDKNDAQMFLEALRQVARDLCPTSCEEDRQSPG